MIQYPGWHLICACVLGSLQSCSVLWDPKDCSPPGSSVHGILQARILEWVAISSSRGSSQGSNPRLTSACTGRWFFTTRATWCNFRGRDRRHGGEQNLPPSPCFYLSILFISKSQYQFGADLFGGYPSEHLLILVPWRTNSSLHFITLFSCYSFNLYFPLCKQCWFTILRKVSILNLLM